MKKKTILIRIDEELLLRFKQYVFDKHGKLHGVFSMELENALRRYLEEGGQCTRVQRHIAPKSMRGLDKLDRIIQWLKGNGYLKQFAFNDWEQAVISTVGADPRTIRKYLELAEKLGRIRHVVGNVWEFAE